MLHSEDGKGRNDRYVVGVSWSVTESHNLDKRNNPMKWVFNSKVKRSLARVGGDFDFLDIAKRWRQVGSQPKPGKSRFSKPMSVQRASQLFATSFYWRGFGHLNDQDYWVMMYRYHGWSISCCSATSVVPQSLADRLYTLQKVEAPLSLAVSRCAIGDSTAAEVEKAPTDQQSWHLRRCRAFETLSDFRSRWTRQMHHLKWNYRISYNRL